MCIRWVLSAVVIKLSGGGYAHENIKSPTQSVACVGREWVS